MKKVLILAAAIVMCASLAFAQSGGHIGIFSDSPGYADCNLVETTYVSNSVYVVHTTAPESNTSQFKVQNNWVGPIVGAVSFGSNLFLGDLYTGITITYVGCKPLPHLLATAAFIPLAATPPCTAELIVVPDPILPSGQIETVDCSVPPNVLFASGGKLTINGNSECPCIVGTEETSWSKVKALYQ